MGDLGYGGNNSYSWTGCPNQVAFAISRSLRVVFVVASNSSQPGKPKPQLTVT